MLRIRLPSYPGDPEPYEALGAHFEALASYPIRRWLALSDKEQLDMLFGPGVRRPVADEPLRPSTRIDPCDHPSIVYRYQHGTPVRDIAAIYEVSRKRIRQILHAHGIATPYERRRADV